MFSSFPAIMQRTAEGSQDDEDVEVRRPSFGQLRQTLPSRLRRYGTCLKLVAFLAINVSCYDDNNTSKYK